MGSVKNTRTILRKVISGAIGLAVVFGTALIAPTLAQAATVYEIEGSWRDAPAEIKTGVGLASNWKFNLNDDAEAPLNEPVENVTVTFTAQNARFTTVPSVCLTTGGVTPVSSISADGRTLICNVGTRDQGTAELLITGVIAEGSTGQMVSLSGEVGGVTAALPEIPINNIFAMDAKFDEGNPASVRGAGVTQGVSFPFSVRHAPGSLPGPASVSYTLTLTGNLNETLTATGCSPITTQQPRYPYSGTGFAADRTAPFPGTCTLTQLSRNVFRLTLSGLDYVPALNPTKDTGGTALEAGWNVIASGMVSFTLPYDAASSVAMSVSTPTYSSASVPPQTSIDLAANNTNSLSVLRGSWTGGWALRNMNPPVEGNLWRDTYRVLAGQRALSISGVAAPVALQSSELCQVLDPRNVTFVSATVGNISGGVVTPAPGVTYQYYVGTGTGNNMNPASANYNPNTFTCDTATGWVTTPPADLSTVKAVKALMTYSAAQAPFIGSNGLMSMYVYQDAKPGLAIGTDIWVWTSYRMPGATAWVNPNRSTNAGDVTATGVLTPGTRYPYTGGGRDIIRVVGAKPIVDKVVDQEETIPGGVLNYTITARAAAPSNGLVNDFIVTDTLPAGLEYVVGSASPAPQSVSGGTITWEFDGMPTNTDRVITLQARVPADAEPATVYTNTATATVDGGTATDPAVSRVREGGYTMLTKTATAAKVPHVNGVASDSWTVRLTSKDTAAQSFTDTIDVLPFNGDARGTSFTGSYVLSQAVGAVTGSTVYYTTADPTTIKNDPKDASNGAPGDATGNTIGWSTTFAADATAVRVIGPRLAPNAVQEFSVFVTTEGASAEDKYVNRADARAGRTSLVMRTSSLFEIGAVNSVALKKYVQDADGEWHDAQEIDDFPSYQAGDTIPYRLVVTNTGDQDLQNLAVSDDKVDLAALDPVPAGLNADGLIELLPAGESVTIEYTVVLAAGLTGQLVNNACVAPTEEPVTPEPGEYAPEPVEQSCDPAGITIDPSTLAWTKVSAESGELIGGSEWELTPVDSDDEPTGPAVAVIDCWSSPAAGCDGPDVNPAPGELTVEELTGGRYLLVETKAPAGFKLDPTPRYIDVLGDVTFGEIENEQQDALEIPLTGGVGTLGFLVLGLGGGLAAGAVLLVKRLKRARESVTTSM